MRAPRDAAGRAVWGAAGDPGGGDSGRGAGAATAPTTTSGLWSAACGFPNIHS
jgi:hypothetical protein